MKKTILKIVQHPKMQMRLIILEIIMCLFISNINYAQDTTSNKKFNKHILFSVGSGIANYYNTNFIDNIVNQPNLSTPVFNNAYYSQTRYHVTKGSQLPFEYSAGLYPFINLGLGIEFRRNRERKIKIAHILESNFLCSFSKNNYDVSYTLSEAVSGCSFLDTNNLKNTNYVASLGYRFQPTYKNFFFSLGAFAAFEHLKINRQTTEYSQSYWIGEPPNYMNYGSTIKTIATEVITRNYINGLLQVGTGAYFKLKKITLKPSFFFISNIYEGTNFYNISLGLIYK